MVRLRPAYEAQVPAYVTQFTIHYGEIKTAGDSIEEMGKNIYNPLW